MSITITRATGRAFTHSSQWGYTAKIDQDGTIWVWDDVAHAYTVCHALTPRQQAQLRAEAQRQTRRL